MNGLEDVILDLLEFEEREGGSGGMTETQIFYELDNHTTLGATYEHIRESLQSLVKDDRIWSYMISRTFYRRDLVTTTRENVYFVPSDSSRRTERQRVSA